MTAPDDMSVAADFGSENQPTPHAVDDALTRESMADLHPSAPVPDAVTPMTPVEPLPSRVHSHVDPKDFVPRHHPRNHSVVHGSAKVGQKQIVTHPPARRNPAARFVYWWNGWVIRTFHTKIGTVLLGTVGAKT